MKTAEEIRSEQIEKFKDRLRKHLLQPTSLQPYPSAAWMTITVSEASLILSELETTQQVTAATEELKNELSEVKRERDAYYDECLENRVEVIELTADKYELRKRCEELEAQVQILKDREEAPTVIIIGEPRDKEALIGRLKEVRADFTIMEREEILKKRPSRAETFIIEPLPIETLCYAAKENKPSHRRPYKFHK